VARSEADRMTRLFEGLIGLRRVRGRVVGDPDVDFAIKILEEELGEAVPQRTAAKAIGISSVEVAKLISSRKLAVVENVRGKSDVLLSALVAYVEQQTRAADEVAAAPSSSEVTPAEFEARSMANDIKQISEMRALAFHRALVRNLDRKMIDEAKARLDERRASGAISADLADQWDEALEKNISDLGAVMTEYSDRGKEMRENSPFDRRAK
jgi:hypothetical protein